MIKYKWEFAERGKITTGGLGVGYFCFTDFVGEYTSFIDVKTQMKKHIIEKLNWKKLHNHLSEDGNDEYNEYFDMWGKKCRWTNAKKKFIKKLKKKNLIIIDNSWLIR